MTPLEYALLVLQDDLSDQRVLLQHENQEGLKGEIEERIESLKKAIKILKEAKK